MPGPKAPKRPADSSSSGVFPGGIDDSPVPSTKRFKLWHQRSQQDDEDGSSTSLFKLIGPFMPMIRRAISIMPGPDGGTKEGAAAGAVAKGKGKAKARENGYAHEPEGDEGAVGMVNGVEHLSLAPRSTSTSYPPLPSIDISSSPVSSTHDPPTPTWRDRARSKRSAAPSPKTPAMPLHSLSPSVSPAPDLRPSQRRPHILKQDHKRRVSMHRQLTAEAARQPVGRRALLSVATASSAATSPAATTPGSQFTTSRAPEDEGGSRADLQARIRSITQAFDFSPYVAPQRPAARQARPERPADTLKFILRNAKAANESPLPPRPSLPTFEKLSLREKDLDGSFTRPRPRLRKFRSHLSESEAVIVKKALATQGEVSSLPGAFVEGKDVQKLLPGRWLNDEIGTFYGVLIMRRAEEAEKSGGVEELKKKGLLKVHCFSSFFMPTYEKRGFDGVKRWTKKTDLFKKDMIIFPLNLANMHWVCAAINLRQKRFEYYDSLGGQNFAMLQRLRQYLQEEHEAKKGTVLDLDDWEDYFYDDVPQQDNGSDCGVFVSQFMECLSRSYKGAPTVFDFTAKNMTYLRQKMIYELATKRLLPEEWA